jgi:predicted ArsR family transcriptional regulator
MNYIKDENFYSEVYECYMLYVEYDMSLEQISREMLISTNTVKRRLDALQNIDDDLYVQYRNKCKNRNKKGCYK